MSCDEYLYAISRKSEIGEFHLGGIRHFVEGRPVEDPVPIPIQAHFEGLVMSTIACADQVAAGIWHLSQIGAERRGLDVTFRDERVAELPDEQTGPLRELWFDASMLDVREVRRRASHMYYDKVGWAGSYLIPDYPINTSLAEWGALIPNREILSYSKTALTLLQRLADRGATLLAAVH